jgi:hypothetical protein
MTIRRTDALRNALMNALNSERGANAQIQIRSGVNAGIGGQGDLLAQLTGNSAGWGTVVNGVLTANPITADNSANASGTAGHYQLNTEAGVFLESGLLDGSDGVTISNPSIVAGQTVQIDGDWINVAAYDDGV